MGWDVQEDHKAGTTPILGHVFNFKSHNNMRLLFSFYRRVQESETLMNMPRTLAREWQMGRNTHFFFLLDLKVFPLSSRTGKLSRYLKYHAYSGNLVLCDT